MRRAVPVIILIILMAFMAGFPGVQVATGAVGVPAGSTTASVTVLAVPGFTGLSITDVSHIVTADGVFTESVSPESTDGLFRLTIDEGTTALTKDGEPLSEITFIPVEDPPAPPEDSSIIGLVYNIGPDGATFDPPIALENTYDPADLPEGVAEEDLVLAYYDEDAGEWVELPSTVDPVTHTITALFSHFTAFTTIAPPPPAPSPGGGNGGGGNGAPPQTPEPEVAPQVKIISDLIPPGVVFEEVIGLFPAETWQLEEDVQIIAVNNNILLAAVKDTIALQMDGTPLAVATMERVSAPPPPPPPEITSTGDVITTAIVTDVIDLGPDDATFSKPLILTMRYDPANLPAGVLEAEMYIAYWKEGIWTALVSTVATEKKLVTARVKHFTLFTVLAPVSPVPPAPEPAPEPTPTPTLEPKPEPKPEPRPTPEPMVPGLRPEPIPIPPPAPAQQVYWWSFLAMVAGIAAFLMYFFLFFVVRGRQIRIIFTSAAQMITTGKISSPITIQLQNLRGKSIKAPINIDIELSSRSTTGKFGTSPSGLFDGPLSSLVIPKGADSATFYYRDTTIGVPTITAAELSEQGWKDAAQQETITSAIIVPALPVEKIPVALPTLPSISYPVTLKRVIDTVWSAILRYANIINTALANLTALLSAKTQLIISQQGVITTAFANLTALLTAKTQLSISKQGVVTTALANLTARLTAKTQLSISKQGTVTTALANLTALLSAKTQLIISQQGIVTTAFANLTALLTAKTQLIIHKQGVVTTAFANLITSAGSRVRQLYHKLQSKISR